MKIISLFPVCVSVYLLCLLGATNCLLDEVSEVFSISKDVTSTIFKTWETVSEHIPPDTEVTPPLLRKREEKLVTKMKHITHLLEDVDRKVNSVTISAVANLRKDIQSIAHYELRVNEVYKMISIIEDAYSRFQTYLPSDESGEESAETMSSMEDEIDGENEEMPSTSIRLRHKHILLDPGNFTEIYNSSGSEDGHSWEEGSRTQLSHGHKLRKNKYEQYTLESFAHATVSHNSDSVMSVLNTLAYQLAPRYKKGFHFHLSKGFIAFIANAFQEGDAVLCSVNQSIQQLVFHLHTYMHTVQLKGYVMMQFSWMLLRLYGKGNFTTEFETEKYKFNKQLDRQMKIALEVMETTSNEMRRCEPQKNVEGKTYEQITRLLQGYVQNEVDMNNRASCTESCSYYSYAKQYGCFKNKFCARQPSCTGRIIDCQYIDSDMGICMAELGSTRRYNWIQYENGRTLGKPGSCGNRYNSVDSWWRYIVFHCSYCFCLCDEPGRNSDRYFSLRPSISNTTANKVVTGVRFAKHNRLIHLQIQEGDLLQNGGIDQQSVSWRPVPDFRIDDMDVKEGVDYHTLSWESRAFDLDDIDLPANCLLTGVRFRMLGNHLNLEAECSPFSAESGKLIKPDQGKMWHGNDNTDGSVVFPRERLELKKPDVSTNAPVGCPTLSSSSNMYVEFTHSDIDADAAQTTIPFIDIQSVAPSPATPLAGVGIYHRGCENFGGYIAPKVMTYDASKHLAHSQLNKANA